MIKRTLKLFVSLTLAVFLLLSVPILSVGCASGGGESQPPKGVLTVNATALNAVVGLQEFLLPTYTAVSASGDDISALVEITGGQAVVIDRESGKAVFKEDGAHTLTYSVVDPATGVRMAYSVTVQRYRQLFSFCNLGGELSQYATASEQYAVSVNSGQGVGVFNLPASDLYYAEAYINATTATEFSAGMSHVEFLSDSAHSWLASLISATDGMKNKFYVESGGLTEVIGASASSGLSAGQGFKYAVARKGNVFYAFVNDKLVGKYVDTALAEKMTIPAILTVAESGGDFVSAGGVKFTQIDYYDGIAAQEKITNLLEGKLGSDIEIDVGDTNWGEYDEPLN